MRIKNFIILNIVIFILLIAEFWYLLIIDENSDFEKPVFNFFLFVLEPLKLIFKINPIKSELELYLTSIFLLSLIYTSIIYLIIKFLKSNKQKNVA